MHLRELRCCRGSGGIGRNFRGGANHWARNVRIEATENGQEIGGAESEADASDIFPGDFQGVETDDLTTGIEKRATGIAGIDRGVGLNPGARAESGEFSDCADDAFCGAKQHGITGIADSEDGFALLDGGDVGKNEKRKDVTG